MCDDCGKEREVQGVEYPAEFVTMMYAENVSAGFKVSFGREVQPDVVELVSLVLDEETLGEFIKDLAKFKESKSGKPAATMKAKPKKIDRFGKAKRNG